MTTRHNGITQTTAMMPAGIAVTKQAGQQYQQPQQTPQLALTAPTSTQRRNNNRRPYILWQHWTTRCHQHQRHQHFSQSNRMRTKSISWSTVEQKHMSAHHGLRPTHPCRTWNMDKGHNWEQQQMKTYQRMGTHGSWWPTSTSNNYIVVSFFVREVTQPILSVATLAEQGFNIQLNETPTVSHTHKGIQLSTCSTWWTLLHDNGVVNIPVNMQLEVHQTTQGTTAKITPATLTPTGMEVLRNRNDLWTVNNQGYLVRVQRTQRKALFVPDQRCPVPTARLENYRRAIVRRNNGNNENIEDACQTLDTTQQKRILEGEPCTEKTWFKVKRVTPLPGNTPPMPALPATRTTVPQQLTQRQHKQQTIKAATVWSDKSNWINFSATSNASTTNNWLQYWIREGHLWKRAHVKPRHDLYIPQQTDDGPDVTKLTTERTTMVRPTNGGTG